MSPIPASDMPGHVRLHERVIAALDRCLESQDTEFKESARWGSLRWRLAKTLMAMANLRDGGVIVIGASQRSPVWELTGVSSDDLSTYDADDVLECISSVASPHVDLDVVTVKYRNGQTFLALRANEFAETPIVCKKTVYPEAGRPSSSPLLEEGAVYIRLPGVAQTVKIRDARHMHDLLELAAEKRARRLLETSRRIGMLPGGTDQFEQELRGL